MASEMEVMFASAERSVEWDSSEMHARCYCHKLALVVRAGLKCLSVYPGHSKPTTEPNVAVPIPTFQLNNEDHQMDAESADSDVEDPLDESDQGSADEDDESPSNYEDPRGNRNIFADAVQKVSLFFSL